MKNRIVLFILSVLVWAGLCKAFLAPAIVIARNTAVVASVNGGDAAYVAQTNIDDLYGTPLIGLLFLVVFFFYTPVVGAFKTKPESK